MPVTPDDLEDWEQGLSADATPADVDAAVEKHLQSCVEEVREAVDRLPVDLTAAERARLVDRVADLIAGSLRAQSRAAIEQALRQLRH